jgi:hypothetical protein
MDVYIVINRKGKVVLHLFERDLTKSFTATLEKKHLILKRKAKQ